MESLNVGDWVRIIPHTVVGQVKHFVGQVTSLDPIVTGGYYYDVVISTTNPQISRQFSLGQLQKISETDAMALMGES